MYIMPTSTASDATRESAQSDFSHSLHGFCNRGGCPITAKNSTAVSTIPKAIATGHLKIVTLATATAIVADEKSGRVTGVNYVRGGQEYFQPAAVVLLASYTYENVRLLLPSKSEPFPNGLSNN